MSNETQAVTAEIVIDAPKLVDPPKDDMLALVHADDKTVYTALSNLKSLDWKDLKPNETAILLTQKPFSNRGNTTYLSYKQALMFAVRCYELGLSPFSDGVWFDLGKGTVNVTFSGKRDLARIRKIDMGPPQFTREERGWDARTTDIIKNAKGAGFPQDIGFTCAIRVGDPVHKETSNYTAWLSEWYVAGSPVWKEKPEHMLQIRAAEKATSLAMGTGVSSMPDEKELE